MQSLRHNGGLITLLVVLFGVSLWAYDKHSRARTARLVRDLMEVQAMREQRV